MKEYAAVAVFWTNFGFSVLQLLFSRELLEHVSQFYEAYAQDMT